MSITILQEVVEAYKKAEEQGLAEPLPKAVAQEIAQMLAAYAKTDVPLKRKGGRPPKFAASLTGTQRIRLLRDRVVAHRNGVEFDADEWYKVNIEEKIIGEN